MEGLHHDWGVVDRAALAIASVHPEPDRLTINPLAGRELEVLTLLLPPTPGSGADGQPGPRPSSSSISSAARVATAYAFSRWKRKSSMS